MDINVVMEHLREQEHNSIETGITSAQLAEEMKEDKGAVSWSLSQQFSKKGGTILRRRKLPPGEGRGWTYWIGVRNANGPKGPKRTTKKHATKRQANGLGIYYCREGGEDIVLTFQEAKDFYQHLKVFFD